MEQGTLTKTKTLTKTQVIIAGLGIAALAGWGIFSSYQRYICGNVYLDSSSPSGEISASTTDQTLAVFRLQGARTGKTLTINSLTVTMTFLGSSPNELKNAIQDMSLYEGDNLIAKVSKLEPDKYSKYRAKVTFNTNGALKVKVRETKRFSIKGSIGALSVSGNRLRVYIRHTNDIKAVGGRKDKGRIYPSNAVGRWLKVIPKSGPRGSLTVESINNPASSIVLAGSTANTFLNVKLTAKDEDIDVRKLTINALDGGYGCNSAIRGEYRDIALVSIYSGTTRLAQASIPSTNKYTFEFGDRELAISKGSAKILTIKADMSTIDPDTDNSPGTASADIKINISNIEAVGRSSNQAVDIDLRNPVSNAMVLRESKPIITLASSQNSFGAATNLTNGNIPIYAFKVAADPSGNVLLYKIGFQADALNSNIGIRDLRLDDQDGDTIARGYGQYDRTTGPVLFTLNNPYFGGTDKEAIQIPAGESRIFRLYATINNARMGDTLGTYLLGDSSCSDMNIADITRGNFIWSDNYQQLTISGQTNNATSASQWYNGHLVPGLDNRVDTPPYVIAQ